MILALPLLLLVPVLVQDEVTDEDFKYVPLDELGADEEMDPQEEAKMLFRRVEKRLREIDDLLNDASAGETQGLSSATESGIGELIKSSRTSSRNVIKDIDRLLELFEGT